MSNRLLGMVMFIVRSPVTGCRIGAVPLGQWLSGMGAGRSEPRMAPKQQELERLVIEPVRQRSAQSRQPGAAG
ncbi:hypothetical protein [Microvirga sp. VF16]|uniref:hypothetical protein n=1 Tax=Microvirga sp. VF16 TaxID=2807101 RepID=UPI00193CCAF7|nr:hypothetical protein [Microvirga sp. VF16]QRM33066.1 hypothetical protein JO965_27525 [Microvirga sp. VF16]